MVWTVKFFSKPLFELIYFENSASSRINQLQIQWKPLNVITDNVIIPLMWSNWPIFAKSQTTLSKVFYTRRRIAYCYHSDNVITFSLSQSDHIKRLPLYLLNTQITGRGLERRRSERRQAKNFRTSKWSF